MPASTLRRTVSIWASPSAPALSLRLVVPALLCHVFHLPHASPTSTSPPRLGSLSFFPASLRHSFGLTPFPLPFFSSPSFHRIFVASFSPHHSLAVILHHFPAVLTSRSTALRPDAGRVHGTPCCQHTIQLLSTTPAADTASISIQPRHRFLCICARDSFVRWCRSVSTRAMRRDRQRVGAPCTVEHRSNLGRGSLPSLLLLSSPDDPQSTSTCAFPW